MTDNEFILQDRINAIRDTINKYGEDKFYISYSGGKDSTIVHKLVDMALPDNKIPRVYINTGIEYNDMVKFVEREKESDTRIEIIKPNKNIVQTLKQYGYPFKSKEHSRKVSEYQTKYELRPYLQRYIKGINSDGTPSLYKCPSALAYQFTRENKIKISDKCCHKLKKEPIHKWAKENNKSINITGMRAEEGGARLRLTCISAKGTKFNPLVKVDADWEEWFLKEYNIELCKLYYSPFNFVRTGCKGCPFAFDLEEQLEIMEKHIPNERKQCELIWKPIYEEYRRLNYRLKRDSQTRLF